MLYETSGETWGKEEGNNNDPTYGVGSTNNNKKKNDKKKKMLESATSIQNLLKMEEKDMQMQK